MSSTIIWLGFENKIEELKAEGRQLIIQRDFNYEYDDLEPWIMNLGLIDPIGKKCRKGTRTHTRSKDAQIDCIFGTVDIKILRGVYLSFERLASDH